MEQDDSPLPLTADELGSLYKAATAAGFRRGLRVIKNERAHRGGKGRDPEPQYQLVLEGTRGTVELTVADVYKKPDADALARIATQAAFLIESLQSRNKLEDYLVAFLKPFQSGDDEGALNTLGRLVRELEVLRGTHKVEPTERGITIADLRQLLLTAEGFYVTVPRSLVEHALRFISDVAEPGKQIPTDSDSRLRLSLETRSAVMTGVVRVNISSLNNASAWASLTEKLEQIGLQVTEIPEADRGWLRAEVERVSR